MADETTTTKRKTDVNFGVQVPDIDVLPPTQRGRRSPLHDLITEVKGLVDSGEVKAGHPVMIANYGKTESAQSTATSLRHMYGKKPDANGLTVAVRKVQTDNGDRAGLFVMYDPSLITKEGQERHTVELAEWNEKQAQKRREAEAKKAAKAAKEGKSTAKK